MLQATVARFDPGQAAPWNTFIKLYSTVDGTSLHLFKESWREIDSLQPPLCEPNGAAASGALLAMESGQGLPQAWMVLLWSRALRHRHLTAQKLAVVSFLQRAWSRAALRALPPAFFSDTLVPTLGQSIMSRGEHSDVIQELIPDFFRQWAEALGPGSSCLELLSAVLHTLAGGQRQQATLIFAARVLCYVTSAAGLAGKLRQSDQAAFMRDVSAASAAQPGYGANAVALQVYSALVSAVAASVVVEGREMLKLVGEWLVTMPLPLLQAGGELHTALADWLADDRHPSMLPEWLEELVNIHLGAASHGAGGEAAEGDSAAVELEGAPSSASSLARLALLLADSIGAESLNTTLRSWKRGLKQSEGNVDCSLPLLLALLQACTPLPGRQPVPTLLASWILDAVTEVSSSLGHRIEQLSVDLLGLTKPEAQKEIAQSCSEACAAAGEDPAQCLHADFVLPEHFVHARNMLSISVECVAAALQLLSDQGSQPQRESASPLTASLANFLTNCAQAYPRLLRIDDQGSGATVDPSMRSKAQLETAIAVLRPLIACCQGLAAARDTSAVASVEPLVMAMCALLQSSGASPALQGPRPQKEPGLSGRKKRSVKLQPLTLTSWLSLLTWRSVDALFGLHTLQGVQEVPPLSCHTCGTVLVAAVRDLACVPEGSNALLPLIRCIRALLPTLVFETEAMVPAVADAASAAGASLESTSLDGVMRWIGGVMVDTAATQNRKRTGLSAAVLSTCLHPCLFKTASPGNQVWALHQAGGAVNDVVHRLWALGARVSRLAVLFATHFAAMLGAFPALGPSYTDIVVQLCMTGFEDETNLITLVRVSSTLLCKTTIVQLFSKLHGDLLASAYKAGLLFLHLLFHRAA